MSAIITNPTDPLSVSPLPNGGLDIRGFEDRENRLEGSNESDSISGGNLADILSGLAGKDTIEGFGGDDTIFGGNDDDILLGGDGNDSLEGNAGNDLLNGGTGSDILRGGSGSDTLISGNTFDTLDGGAGRDRLIAAGGGNILSGGTQIDRFELDITQQSAQTLDEITDYERGEKIIVKGNGPSGEFTYDPETGRLSLNGQEIAQLSPGLDIDLGDVEFLETIGLQEFLNDPSQYMDRIRDFDGNNLGGAESWKRIGSADVQGDGDEEYIFVNPEIGRWATVGPDETDRIDFSNHGEGGDTRVVGVYRDPQVEAGVVEPGSPFDSQQRFQNDLLNDNLSLIENGDDDYDGDGLQEVYFRVNDGTAVLHALMHADGNIQYANYQSAQDLAEFMNENGIDSAIWEDWI